MVNFWQYCIFIADFRLRVHVPQQTFNNWPGINVV